MPELLHHRLQQELEALKEQNRYRSLRRPAGVNFGSNDYLGFAIDAELRERALGALRDLPLSAASSRLLPGYHAAHSLLEASFAEFVSAPSALYFSSGYAANLAVIMALATRHDLVLFDDRSHASWYDAIHSSHATSFRFKHNDVDDLRGKLQRHRDKQHAFVVAESVYSMDGDLAPLDAIANATQEAGATLIVDEAHATGVVGPSGRGLSATLRRSHPDIVSVHTCGKALGSAGALVAGHSIVIDYLINVGRPLIFTTALPSLLAMQVLHAVERLQSTGDELTMRLRERSCELRERLRTRLDRWSVPEGTTPIIPVIIGDDRAALQAAEQIAQAGFDVPAIRPPTVPAGTSRLRLNVSLSHSDAELREVVKAIVDAEHRVAA